MNDDIEKRSNTPSSGKPLTNTRAGFGRQIATEIVGARPRTILPITLPVKFAMKVTSKALPRPPTQPRTHPINFVEARQTPQISSQPYQTRPQQIQPKPQVQSQQTIAKAPAVKTPLVKTPAVKTLITKMPQTRLTTLPAPTSLTPMLPTKRTQVTDDVDLERVTKFVEQIEAYTGTKVKII